MESNTRMPAGSSPDETEDAIFGGRLHLVQPARGYRFSVDAPLVTAFASSGKRARLACDLGTGCGVVGLGLAWSGTAQRVVGVELQPDLAELASRNVTTNGLSDRVKIVAADVRTFRSTELEGRCDLVVSNPPYFPADGGHLPEHLGCRIAGFEVAATLADFLSCGRRLLCSKGRMCLVYPTRRLDVLLTTAIRQSLSATRLRFVHPVEGRAAELVLAELRLGKPGRIEVASPLILRTQEGVDTFEATAILAGEFAVRPS